MYNDLNVLTKRFGDLADRTASCMQKLHYICNVLFPGHAVIDLISDLYHTDIHAGI